MKSTFEIRDWEMEREDNGENCIHHVSHLHPLKLTNLVERENTVNVCYACRGSCAGEVYKCEPCDFLLHTTCARLSRTLRHAAHPAHPLLLRLMPPYSNSIFICNACGRDGAAFCFHCPRCQFDLHLPCAVLPEKLNHQSHRHTLTLTYHYKGPLGETGCICDLCRQQFDASSQWLYLCKDCDFGGHVSCFSSDTRPANAPQQAANPGQQLLDLQLKLQASMMAADISVRSSRAAANLVGSGPCQYGYYDAGPLPSQYAAMANSIVMNNLALLSLNNNANGGGGGGSGGNGASSNAQNARSQTGGAAVNPRNSRPA